MRRYFMPLFLISLSLTVALPAADPAFGDARWSPSPTDAVGFAGQGANWYPGATPPQTWHEEPGKPAKGIAWKVPIPGWTNAQPIVVGDRVIGVYSPHHVVCYDAKTGTVLWQDELELMSLPVLDENLKPGPAPAAKQAAHEQLLFERAISLHRVAMALMPHKKKTEDGRAELAKRRALTEHLHQVLSTWKQEYDSADPEAAEVVGKDLSALQTVLDGQWVSKKVWPGALISWFEKKMRPPKSLGLWRIWNNWQGSVSDTMAAPISDGEIVGVTFGFGQVAAYELATGKRLWGWRHPGMNPGSTCHCASPQMWKDLLLVPAPGEKRDDGWRQAILGVDKRTGAVRWKAVDNVAKGKDSYWGVKSAHGIHQSPYLWRMDDGTGGVRPVLVSSTGNFVDPETGESLGQAPASPKEVRYTRKGKPWGWGCGFAAASGNRLFKTYGADAKTGPIYAFLFGLDGQRRPVWQDDGFYADEKARAAHGPFAVSDRYLVVKETLCDAATGSKIASLHKHGRQNGTSIIAGDYLLQTRYLDRKATRAKEWAPSGRLPLTTLVFDLRGKEPKEIATNTITAEGYTPDISHEHFPKFGSDPALRRIASVQSGTCNYQGIGFQWSTETAGLTAHGDRLFTHSPAHLYCIGGK